MARIPGSGIVRGMALTLTRFFQPKKTVMYPEVKPDIPPRNRGRLELVTDERGTLKCETCFQCAQAVEGSAVGFYRGFVQAGVDLGEQLALFHLIARLHMQAHDLPGYLRANLH